MRAMAVVDYRRPLELVERSVPTPGPGEVLVRVLACGVCYSDVKTATGHMPYSPTLRLPHVPGHEIVGTVAARGAGAMLREGQRVVVYNYRGCGTCPRCRAGEENVCLDLQAWIGFTSPGGFQEYLAVPESHVLPLPDSTPTEMAAALSCATGTSYRALVARGRVQPGETVLVVGVGGVGLQAVQVARASGARVLAVDVDDRKLARALSCGAGAAARADQMTAAWVRDQTDGAGADLVVETAGREAALALASAAVRVGGRVVLVGYTVGAAFRIPSAETVLGEVSYVGSRYVKRDELARAVALVASGAVQPAVDAVLDLEQANEAFARLVRGEPAGRLVLRVASDGTGGAA